MRSAFVGLLVVAGLGGAGAARADEPPDSAWYPRVTAGAGVGFWLGDVAGLVPSGPSAHVEGELRVTPALFVSASYDLASTTAHDEALRAPLGAVIQQGAVAVRHPVFSFGSDPAALGGDMFVIGGMGREWLRWDGGARLQRSNLSMGMGGTVILPRHDRSSRFVLIRYDFRFLVARAPDPGKLPLACDGPCDRLTKTAPYDHTMLLEITGHFGR